MRILRHIFVFSLLILAAVILRRSVPPLPALTQVEHNNQVQGESTQNSEYFDITENDLTTRIRWFIVDNHEDVSLVANYDARTPSADAYEENSCRYMINGGFYDVDSSPLGLVVSNRSEVSGFRRNSLLNGILSINEFDTPRITRSIPTDSIVHAVQTGPVLWENGSEVNLSITNDEQARRVVGAVTGSNELMFIAFYSPKSVYLGPTLTQLPEMIAQLNNEFNLNIADAINLDGGSASTFITPDFSLSEISPVGSFWCVK